MTQEQKQTLMGKWRFIGAERYSDSKWTNSNNYVKEMMWEIYPQYFGEDKIIGNIVETTLTNSPIKMSYAYNKKSRQLKIEIFTDPTTGLEDRSEFDVYDVIYTDNDSVIKLSLNSNDGSSTLFFRYVLERM